MRLRTVTFTADPVFGNLDLDFTDPATGRAAETVVFAGANGTRKTRLLKLLTEFGRSPQRRRLSPSFSFEISAEELVEGKDQTQMFLVDLRETSDQVPRTTSMSLEDRLGGGDYVFRPSSADGGKIAQTSLYELQSIERTDDRHVVQVASFAEATSRGAEARFLPVEVDYTANPITTVTSKTIGPGALSSGAPGASTNVGTVLHQLLVDLSVSDDETFAAAARENPDLPARELQVDSRFERFADAFSIMFEGRTLLRPKVTKQSKRNVMVGDDGLEYPLDGLSLGEKQILFRAGQLVAQPMAKPGRSMYFVDEPETSLHPDWQKKILHFYERLGTSPETGERAQLFVATHSPFIVHGNSRARVIVLERDGAGGVRAASDPRFDLPGGKALVEAFGVGDDLNLDPRTLVLTEGKTDRTLLETAWKKRRGGVPMPFAIRAAGSAGQVRFWLTQFEAGRTRTVVGVLDADHEGGREFVGLASETKPNAAWTSREGNPLRRQKNESHIRRVAMLLPVPESRCWMAGVERHHRHWSLPIELLFDDEHLGQNLTHETVYEREVPQFTGDKVAFAKRAKDFDADAFVHFDPLLEALAELAREDEAAERSAAG